MQSSNELDATCVNTIRTLAMDAVQAANSGHPGTPMDVVKKFGFTPEHVVAAASEQLRVAQRK